MSTDDDPVAARVCRMMSPEAFAQDYIHVWEDGSSVDPKRILSLDPDDAGNWSSGTCGQGMLCGSQHGVTAQALASFRNCPVADITQTVMGGLTIGEAAAIAVANYYKAPGLAQLPWDAVVASVMDFGWGTGPRQAVLILQREIGVADDGQIGPFTTRAYAEWIASHGLEGAANLWAAARNAFYQTIVAKRPVNARYLRGWMNRTAYFQPGTAWWQKFQAG